VNYEIIEALGQIAREKSVDRQLLIDTLEAGLLSAAKKKHGANALVGVKFDDQKGVIEMWLTKTVVANVDDYSLQMTLQAAREIDPMANVGQEVRIPLDIAEFGRNAIQAAKQVLVQRVREAEREMVYDEYVDKVGSLVRGVVQQVDRGSVIVKINLTEAVIPARELINRDRFRQRDHVRAYVLAVDKQSKGPQVILSRTHPTFLVKLFEAEVPEIAEGIVEIKSVAREAGHRSKIAVYSRDDRIDAVGACVGIKGSRVQAIVRELGGERIDIVPWSSDPVLFVGRALNPAKVIQASLDEAEHKITVIVADEQLSLAIGKGGQNARLAAKLTNWNIDLVSQSEVEAKKKAQGEADVPVEELEGLSPKMAQKLVSSGIETADEVKKAGIEGLTAVEGVGEKTAEKILASAVAALAALAATASAADAGSGNAVEDAGESEAGDVSVVETDDMVEDAEVAEETVAAAVETPAIQAGASGAVMNSVVTQSDEEMTRRPRDEDDDEHVWDIEREDTIVDDEDEDDENEDDEDDEEEELDLGIDEGDDA
jgi:N utilization substance protein A